MNKGINLDRDINQKLGFLMQTVANNKENEEVLDKFKEFLQELVKLGSYNVNTWRISENLKRWQHYVALAQSQYAPSIKIELERQILNSSNEEETEVLECLLFEILWGMGSGKSKDYYLKMQDKVEELLIKYPYNIELEYTSGHTYGMVKDNFKKTTAVYKLCFDKWGINRVPSELVNQEYNRQINYVQYLLEEEKYLDADLILQSISENPHFKQDTFFNNHTRVYLDRLRDRKFLEAKVNRVEKTFKNSMHDETSAQNKKSIEQLGLFSAVITFIVTAAASSLNSNQTSAPIILITIGLILVLLIGTISLFNANPKKIWSDNRAWILVVYLVVTVATISVTAYIEYNKPTAEEYISYLIDNEAEKLGLKGEKLNEAKLIQEDVLKRLVKTELAKQQPTQIELEERNQELISIAVQTLKKELEEKNRTENQKLVLDIDASKVP